MFTVQLKIILFNRKFLGFTLGKMRKGVLLFILFHDHIFQKLSFISVLYYP